MSEDEPKLIIDDDWKERVQKEKEAAEKAALEKEAGTSTPSSGDTISGASEGSSPQDDDALPPPPASLEMLVSMLASQTLISLGQIPNPMSGKPEPNKAYARHYIDTIAMLEEKTKGNVTAEEQQLFSQTLHQLRMLFVSIRS
ncbi:MAG: DUF1844 domain-containing protein [Pirellulaceae bacterium]